MECPPFGSLDKIYYSYQSKPKSQRRQAWPYVGETDSTLLHSVYSSRLLHAIRLPTNDFTCEFCSRRGIIH